MPAVRFVGYTASMEGIFKFDHFGEKAELTDEQVRAAVVDERVPLMLDAEFVALKLTDQQVKDFYLNDDNIELKRKVWTAANNYRESLVHPQASPVIPFKPKTEEV